MKNIGCLAVIAFGLWSIRSYGAEPNERVFPADGAVQVWVPGGTFTMGVDDPTQPDRPDERPPHAVTVDGFWMDKYEVTCEQYVQYFNKKMKDKSRQERIQAVEGSPLNWPESGIVQDRKTGEVRVKSGCGRWPVLADWHGAQDYCETLGKVLPSEAQWEWAAKGPEGRCYPWGNEWSPKTANVGTDKIRPVGAFPKDVSPFGIVDMGGNVREWCGDKYEVEYYKTSAAKNPFNWSGTWEPCDRAIRGGGYGVTEWDARTTSRNFAPFPYRAICVGFRCVAGGEPPKGKP
jgi:formylglycine-generating enzyme required for sulfatase activity